MTERPGWTTPDEPAGTSSGGVPGWPSTPGASAAPSPSAPPGPAAPGGTSGWGSLPGGGPAPGWGPAPGGGPRPGWGPPPKPGVIPLRPLGVGEILDGAISSIRANPKAMIGVAVLFAVLVQLLQAPLMLLLNDYPRSALGGEALTGGSAVVSLVGGVLALLAQLVVTGLLTTIVSRAVLGERMGAGEAWRRVRPRIPALLGASALYLLILVAILAVCLAPGLALLAAGQEGSAVALLGLGGLLGGCLLIYAYVSLVLAPQAVVLERQGVRSALTRARALTRGSFWRTFGILILLALISGILGALLSVPFTLVAAFALSGAGGGSEAVASAFVVALGAILSSAITWPFVAAGTTLLYVDLRMRREGLDIALARSAGVPASRGPSGP